MGSGHEDQLNFPFQEALGHLVGLTRFFTQELIQSTQVA